MVTVTSASSFINKNDRKRKKSPSIEYPKDFVSLHAWDIEKRSLLIALNVNAVTWEDVYTLAC